ncbi:MAG: response regulator transcription factor [Oscillospiraceae bacterium]|jgi:two-component system response regulator VicR|nr:response regulator transcription factor [Oscillospiraceae bacterium]
MRTILIVDDEKSIVDILKYNLKKEYNIVEAYDGAEALERYAEASPDLILLDIMLPRLDGFEVCRRIRAGDKKTPIIMLTARGDETDMITGLELGADDYITKPSTNANVLARVRAHLRRAEAATETAGGSPGLVIDPERFDAFTDGAGAGLTPREFELLCFLSESPGKVFSREDLLRDVWQYEYFGDPRAVDVAVRRLREKIEPNSAEPVYVLTKRGVGYYFSENRP